MVETFDGCTIDVEPISSIIYHEYWNKIRIEASRIKGNNYEQGLAIQKALATVQKTVIVYHPGRVKVSHPGRIKVNHFSRSKVNH